MSLYVKYPPSSSASGVAIYANLAAFPVSAPNGTLGVAADTHILYEYNSTAVAWQPIASNTAYNNAIGAPTSIGALDSQAANAQGLALSGNVLSTQSADATHPGVVNNTTQTFAGAKSFSGVVNANAGVDLSAPGTLAIGTSSNTTTINIGNAGTVVNIQGTTIYENTPLLQVADPLITVNHGGAVGSGSNSGIEIEENGVITGYTESSANRNSWIFKAPNTAGIVTLTPGVAGFTIDQASHDPITLGTFGTSPNSSGASLSGQVLTLQPASATQPGGVSTTTQVLAGAKNLTGLLKVGTIGSANDGLAPSAQFWGADGISILGGNGGRGLGVYTSDFNNSSTGSRITLGLSASTGDTSGRIQVVQAGSTANGTLALMPDGGATTIGGTLLITSTVSASNLSGTNTGDVTLTPVGAAPNANGASLSGQALTLQPANTSFPGVLLAADWNTFNNKQPAGTYVTAISIASANGLAGSSTGGATPALTLSTSITGILQGNGTAISAASTTGSGAVVLATSATLVTPALGTPTALVGTNITGTAAGLTAGNVTTNANLTGVITSVGNATSIASQTGTGTKFVVDTSPTLVTPVIGAATGTSLSVSGQLTSTVATGTAPFVVSSTTQVANLNAATAGTVTTNANLTGPITSVGNATSIASQTGTGSTIVVSVSPTLTGTIAGASQTLSGTLRVTGLTTIGTIGTANSGLSESARFWAADGVSILGGSSGRGLGVFTSDYNNASTGSAIRFDVGGATGNTTGDIRVVNNGSTTNGPLAIQAGGGALTVGGSLAVTGQLIGGGTTTNNSASAGQIGEAVRATVASPGTTLTTGTGLSIASISLTAGDWDVSAMVCFNGNVTGAIFNGAISATTNTLPGGYGDDTFQTPYAPTAVADNCGSIPSLRVSLASTTTYYLVAQATFTVGTTKAYGRISARRVR